MLRKLLAGTVVGGSALAVANRLLQSTAADLPPALDGEQHTNRWRGIEIAYTTVGDESNPPLVMFHGINAAGSSGEFRAIVDDLAEDYYVIVPELPGFGRSGRPPLRYSATFYQEFIADFLSDYEEPAVVASSLSAAYTLEAVATDPDVDVFELLLICPAAVAGPEPPKQWLRELFRLPVIGTGLFNLVVSKPSIRYFNADHGYYDTDNVSEEWINYEWQTAHQPNARFAPASFISGYLNADCDLAELLATSDVPTTIIWGRDAEITPLEDGRELASEGEADLIVFDNSMLLPHVEYPEQFVDLVDDEFSITE